MYLMYMTILVQMEAKVIMGNLLLNFEFTLPDKYVLTPVTVGVLQPKGDIPCTLVKRHRKFVV